jgi:glutathione S-transferase
MPVPKQAIKHRLYYSPGSCSLAAHIVLEEIGLPYELELVDSRGGKMTDTDTWRAINPKGRVPALSGVPGRIGGQLNLLTEAAAILTYLARAHPASRLLPKDAAGEARCLEWMNWLSSNVHAMSYGQIWRPQRFVDDETLFPAVKTKGLRNLKVQYAYIEGLLADGRTWAVGDEYSIVDPYLLTFFRWGQSAQLPMSQSYPAWRRLVGQVMERPAVRRVFEHEGLKNPFEESFQ